MFAAILLVVAGTLNVIYGIAAIDNADFFEGSTAYVIETLDTWGWVTLILGVIQLTGGFSLAAGRPWGVIVGITGAILGAIGSLMAVAGAHPFWSLGIFALCLIVLHGLVVYGEDTQGV
jgi:hypothetical protein